MAAFVIHLIGHFDGIRIAAAADPAASIVPLETWTVGVAN